MAEKNPTASAGDARDVGSIPGSGRSPGKGNGNPFHIFGWEITWTEELGRLNSKGEFPNGGLGRNIPPFMISLGNQMVSHLVD